jgi:uncharacterized protein YecE (DUF72 family)
LQLYIGTSGYSYKEWKGPFYRENLAARDMLRFYGERLPAVEINNTFYSMPRDSVLKVWAAQVPPAFRFALKAPRRITHSRPLKEKEDEVSYFCGTAATLGAKLGAILFQLPPHLPRDIELLADFIELLPPKVRAAFEFRHRSWFDDKLYEILHRKGCAVCCADDENEELGQFVVTADWGYLRFRRPDYSDAELFDWARKIKSQNWQMVFAFFKHEAAGLGPKMAKRLLDMATEAGNFQRGAALKRIQSVSMPK